MSDNVYSVNYVSLPGRLPSNGRGSQVIYTDSESSSPMHILQAANGVFHHFELARQLDAQGHTGQIFSTFPWRRLQREGLPKDRIHTPQLVVGKRWSIPYGLNRQITRSLFRTFDTWVAKNLTGCDAYVALSG